MKRMESYEPKGIKFYDKGSSREMMFVYEGEWADWIFYKHPDGQWVSLRKATDEDQLAIDNAVSRAYHLI